MRYTLAVNQMSSMRKGKRGLNIILFTCTCSSCSRDASFVPWVTDFRRHLLYEFPLAKGVEPIPEHVLLESKWLLSLGQGKSIDFSKILMDSLRNGDTLPHDSQQTRCETEPSQGLVKDAATPSDWRIQLTLEENQRMTPNSHWQDVRHLAFSSPLEVAYGPGDVLTIYPQNTQEDVDQILRRMDWTDIAEKEIQFTPTGTVSRDGLYPSPPISLASGSRMTLRKLLTEHLDLTAIPRRSFFSLVAHFTADQFHKDRLLEFTKPEYIDELYDYTTRPRRSILEVLQEFESVKIPWQWAANILPELRGRQFSIASGGRLKHGPEGSTRFELLVAIVKYKTVIKKIREGICTRYLAALRPGAQILVTLQGGGLGITKAEAQRPVVMIGPGTGVAPMRSLIWERRLWTEEMRIQSGANANGLVNCTKNVGKSLLLYGCRNQSADYFYREEWMHLKDMMPVQVEAAFSRDQSRKIYVQDLISQHSEEVFRLLHDLGGIVYVCGSSGKMPTAVRAALVDVFKKHGAMYEDAAGKFLETVEKEGRYKQETW